MISSLSLCVQLMKQHAALEALLRSGIEDEDDIRQKIGRKEKHQSLQHRTVSGQ